MLKGIKAVAFDLDGTIYFGNTLAEGADGLVDFLVGEGIKVFYFTNNSIKTRTELKEKLTGMGLAADISQIYNSAYAAAVYVKEKGAKKVYCVGSEGLKEEIRLQGISVSSKDVEIIVIGLDADFTYRKLADVLHIYSKTGCPIVACNRERNYPVEHGVLMPGCGPIVSSIENACATSVDYVVGKPNTYMMAILTRDWKLDSTDVLVVGDSYDSDIEMARKFSCRSVLISKSKQPDVHDAVVVRDISDIKELFEGVRL